MIVRRATIRLTLLFIATFAVVLGIFSAVFYVAFAVVLQPDFDIAPDLTGEQVAQVAYGTAIERVALSLVVADLVAVALVSAVAWILARRTLAPVRDAHAPAAVRGRCVARNAEPADRDQDRDERGARTRAVCGRAASTPL